MPEPSLLFFSRTVWGCCKNACGWSWAITKPTTDKTARDTINPFILDCRLYTRIELQISTDLVDMMAPILYQSLFWIYWWIDSDGVKNAHLKMRLDERDLFFYRSIVEMNSGRVTTRQYIISYESGLFLFVCHKLLDGN